MARVPIEKEKNHGLWHKSGIQVVTHISIALTIVLASLSISIINKSALYTRQVEMSRSRIGQYLSKEFQFLVPEDEEEAAVENERGEEVNEIILYNLSQIASVLFISGVGALGGSLFQFMTSLILLCTLHKKASKASSEFWIAVTCGVTLCLLTSLILLLCLDITPYPYHTVEQIFILFITIDMLFCIYALWIVISLI